MKRNRDWTDELRRSVREAEVQPSEEVWARLERELGAAPCPFAPEDLRAASERSGRGAGAPLRWLRPAAAAALLALLAGGGWLLYDRSGASGALLPASGPREGEVAALVAEPASGPASDVRSVRGGADGQEGSERNVVASAAELGLSTDRSNPSRQVAGGGTSRSAGAAERLRAALHWPGSEAESASAEGAHAEKPFGTGTARAERFMERPLSKEPLLAVMSRVEAPVVEPLPALAVRKQGSAAASAAVPGASPAAVPVAVDRPTQTALHSGSSRRMEPSRHREPAAVGRSGYPPRQEAERLQKDAAAERSSRRMSFGAFASGAPEAARTTGAAPLSATYAALVAPVSNDVVLSHRFEYPDNSACSFRHHQTLSFGLSFRYALPYGLSLGSGVNYSLLRSDVKLRISSEDVGQQLHFIGIPLRLDWRFLQRGGFSLYIGAGVMAEMCVAARFGSTAVREPGLQWSVGGALGAQYDLSRRVGLYFEPALAWYLTRTRLTTARTDSPLDLTLRLGMRFSF